MSVWIAHLIFLWENQMISFVHVENFHKYAKGM